MTNLKKKFLLLFNIALALLAFLASIEVGARIDDYVKYGASPIENYSAETLRSSKNGIPFNVPLARFEKWQNNSFGFRGAEFSERKAPGKIRVVCLGASESYGLYESPGKEWPAQLQDLLSNTNFEVVNASIVGLNFHKYLLYYDSYISRFSPDVVVMVINPLLYFTSMERSGSSAVTTTPVLRETVKRQPVLHSELLKKARCFPRIKQVIKEAIAASFPSMLNNYQLSTTAKMVQQIESQRLKGVKPKDAVPKGYLLRFRNDISEVVKSFRSQGVEVILTTYPSLMNRDNLDEYPDIFLSNRKFCVELSLLGMIDAFHQFNAVITSVAAERRIMVADCQRLMPKSIEYFSDNVHYRDKGARVFAESVAAQLRSHGLKP